jgi:VWFA-related protein
MAQLPGMAQRGDPQLAERPPAKQSEESRSVTLDVRVEDALGRPVLGLQPKDFSVMDNATPEKIATFSSSSTGTDAVEIIFVFDALSSSFEDVARARQQLSGFLREDGGQLAHPVTIVWLEKAGPRGKKADALAQGVIPIQNGAAFLHVIPASTDGVALAKKLDASDILVSGSLAAQGISSAQVRLSLQALEVLASGSAARPSRKMLIWVSPGWPLLSQPDSKMREQLFDYVVYLYSELRRARVTLYAVNPGGVSTAFNSDGPVAKSPNPLQQKIMDYSQVDAPTAQSSYSAFLKSPLNVKQVSPNAVSLQVLAMQTGGLVVEQGNDIGAGIRRCVAEADSYYSLSYAAPVAKEANEYHATQVKVDRRAVTVRTRTGYYAQLMGMH